MPARRLRATGCSHPARRLLARCLATRDRQREREPPEAVDPDELPAWPSALVLTGDQVYATLIFDDHDITDDWNLSREWEEVAHGHPFSKRVIGNARR
jgi:hypothetical protein